MSRPWQLMPVGNNPAPLMFVCRGDGLYDVEGQFRDDVPRLLTVTFIEVEAFK